MGKRRIYALRHERLVFITPKEQAELDAAYQDYLKSEDHVCYYVFVGGSEAVTNTTTE